MPEGGSTMPATARGLNYFSYYYDIVNDKILSIGETAKALNLELEGIETAEGNKINTYDELEKYNYIMKIDGNKIEVESNI